VKNPECERTPLYIFSDAARCEADRSAVRQVREFAHTITGFLSVEIIERSINMGLASSIISGVSHVFSMYERVIVLEDDLIVSSNFIAYMHQCLEKYENNLKVCSVSGYSSQRIADLESDQDIYFGRRSSSWGWGIWKDRWESVDWEVRDISILKNRKNRRKFRRGGADLLRMLRRQQQGKIDSWAIRFSFYQYITDSFDIVPKVSKVINCGFTKSATNTAGMETRFSTTLDLTNKRIFDLPNDPFEDKDFMIAFRVPFRTTERLKFKFLSLCHRIFGKRRSS